MRSITLNFVWTALTLFFFSLVTLLFCTDGQAIAAGRILQIESQITADGETAEIQLSEASHFSHFVLHAPERIVVDIKDCVIPEVHFEKRPNGVLIKKIRAAQNTKDKTRVVLEINEGVDYAYAVANVGPETAPRLEIQVSGPKATVLNEQESLPPASMGTGSQPQANISGPQPQGQGSPLREVDTRTASSESENLADPFSQEAASQKADNIEPFPDNSTETQNQETNAQDALLDTGMPDDIFSDSEPEEDPSGFSLDGKIQIRPVLTIKDREGVENNNSFRNKVTVEGLYKDVILLSVRSDYIYFGSEDRTDDYDLDLYEAKWMYHGNAADISLGKQIIRWGKTDQMSPVDTLNPEDLREFVIPDYEERKMPVWMADVTLRAGVFNLEGVFIPFFEKADMDYYKTNWSMFGHIKKEISNAAVPPYLKTYFNNMGIHETDPSNEKEWGARLTSTQGSVDIGLMYHRATEDLPYISSFPIKNLKLTDGFSIDSMSAALGSLSPTDFTNENIEIEYKRTNIFGLEFETTLSGLGVRGEAAWRDKESFLTDNLTSERLPSLFYIVGADYTTAGNTYLNLQFGHKHISDYNSSVLFFDRDTYSIMGKLSMDIVSDWLQLCFEFTRNLNNTGAYYNPYFKYTYIINLECRAGAGFFSGGADTWLGRYKDYDFIYLDITYRF